MPASVKHGSWILNQLERRLRERARKSEKEQGGARVQLTGDEGRDKKKKGCQENLWNVSTKKNAKEKLDQNDSFGVFIWASAAAWALLLFVFELLFTFPVNDLQKELSKKCAQTNLNHYCVSHLLSFSSLSSVNILLWVLFFSKVESITVHTSLIKPNPTLLSIDIIKHLLAINY